MLGATLGARTPARTLPWRRLRLSRSSAIAVIGGAVLLTTLLVGMPITGAIFTGAYPVGGDIAASRIFRDERVTPPFAVGDSSSGSAQSRSSATAFGNDGLYFLSRTWPSAFDSSRYLDLEFNSPLPAGLTAQSVALNIRVSSDAGTGSACLYLEVRRASTNALLSSHGSSGSPLACTSGTQVTTLNVGLAVVSTADVANDLRVRLYARDSAAGAIRLDQMTVDGATPYAGFTLYPILTREQFSGQQELLRWGLAGP
jgi:hypothetical protein